MKKVTIHENQRERTGAKCSFNVTVCCMHNATWQGWIHWVEKNQEQAFRSVLEMLKLMDEAITNGADNTG